MGTEKTPHTPKGYRIEGENKYLRISGKGTEIEADATECEMELWQINTELITALEANNDLLFGLLDYFEPGHELTQINAQRERNIELLAGTRR